MGTSPKRGVTRGYRCNSAGVVGYSNAAFRSQPRSSQVSSERSVPQNRGSVLVDVVCWDCPWSILNVVGIELGQLYWHQCGWFGHRCPGLIDILSIDVAPDDSASFPGDCWYLKVAEVSLVYFSKGLGYLVVVVS